jgi:hypothetical protein
MASSLARPPAFLITWASPSLKPAYFAGSKRASMHVRMAKWRAGGSGNSDFPPNVAAYSSLACSTPSRSDMICPPRSA